MIVTQTMSVLLGYCVLINIRMSFTALVWTLDMPIVNKYSLQMVLLAEILESEKFVMIQIRLTVKTAALWTLYLNLLKTYLNVTTIAISIRIVLQDCCVLMSMNTSCIVLVWIPAMPTVMKSRLPMEIGMETLQSEKFAMIL